MRIQVDVRLPTRDAQDTVIDPPASCAASFMILAVAEPPFSDSFFIVAIGTPPLADRAG
jgi:hypothetical protein